MRIRHRNFNLMKKKFSNIPEITFMDEKNKKYNPNYYAFSVILNNKDKNYRNKFIQKLNAMLIFGYLFPIDNDRRRY